MENKTLIEESVEYFKNTHKNIGNIEFIEYIKDLNLDNRLLRIGSKLRYNKNVILMEAKGPSVEPFNTNPIAPLMIEALYNKYFYVVYFDGQPPHRKFYVCRCVGSFVRDSKIEKIKKLNRWGFICENWRNYFTNENESIIWKQIDHNTLQLQKGLSLVYPEYKFRYNAYGEASVKFNGKTPDLVDVDNKIIIECDSTRRGKKYSDEDIPDGYKVIHILYPEFENTFKKPYNRYKKEIENATGEEKGHLIEECITKTKENIKPFLDKYMQPDNIKLLHDKYTRTGNVSVFDRW